MAWLLQTGDRLIIVTRRSWDFYETVMYDNRYKANPRRSIPLVCLGAVWLWKKY
jgi:hypothetical protein